MIFYMIILVLTTGSVYLGDYYDKSMLLRNINSKHKYLTYSLVFSCILLISIGSLRSLETGADVIQYSKYFYNGYHTGKMEWGYVLISNFVFYTTNNYRIFLVVLQIITITPVFFVIAKTSKKPYLSVFLYNTLYLYAGTFNILRQAVAMSIVLLAYYVLIRDLKIPSKKSIIYSSLLIILASSFHIVSLVFLLIPLLSIFKLTPKILVLILLFSGLVLLLRNSIVNAIFIFLGRGYYEGFQITIGWTSIVIIGSVTLLLFMNNKEKLTIYSKFPLDINIIISSLILNVFWVWFPNHARITQFFFLVMIIIIPNQLSYNKSKFNKRVLLMILFFVFFYAFQLIYRDYAQVVPYSVFL